MDNIDQYKRYHSTNMQSQILFLHFEKNKLN